MSELVLIFGGLSVIGILVTFMLRPRLAMLVFYGSLPLIAFFSTSKANTAANLSVKTTGLGLNLAFGGIMHIFILLAGLVYILANMRKDVLKWPGAFWFIIFLFISGFCIINSSDPMEGIKYWVRLASIFVLYILTANVMRNERNISPFVTALLIGLIIPIIVGFYQFFTDGGMQDVRGWEQTPFGPHRIFSIFNIPNTYAAYLALPALLSCAYALDIKSPLSRRCMYGILAFIVMISLFLTYTRASWLGVFVGLSYIGFKKYKKIIPILAVLVVLLATVFTAEQLRFGEVQKNNVTGSGRLVMWQATLPYAFRAPIFGFGLTNATQIIKKATGSPNGGQNEYFKVFLESGILGLIPMLLTFIMMFIGLLRVSELCRGDTKAEIFLFIITAYFIASAIISLFENYVLLDSIFIFPIAVAIGIGNARGQISNSTIQENKI